MVDRSTGFYRYRTYAIAPYRAEVVAVLTDFNTLSASLQLLLFREADQWVATVPLAFYYEEAGAEEAHHTVQTTATRFEQTKVVSDFEYTPEKPGQERRTLLGRSTMTIRSVVTVTEQGVIRRQIDSTYVLHKE